jgi:hypothetical protein
MPTSNVNLYRAFPAAKHLLEQFGDKKCQKPAAEALDCWVLDVSGSLIQAHYAIAVRTSHATFRT